MYICNSNNSCDVTFVDIDECEEDLSECDHICDNINGSYVCSCMDGYYLDMDDHTCNGILIISMTITYA